MSLLEFEDLGVIVVVVEVGVVGGLGGRQFGNISLLG